MTITPGSWPGSIEGGFEPSASAAVWKPSSGPLLKPGCCPLRSKAAAAGACRPYIVTPMSLLAVCRLLVPRPCVPLAAYNVSTPSGMMTMRAVPTSTPVPSAVIRRNCRGVSANESGRMPAAKELQRHISTASRLLRSVMRLTRRP